MNSLSESALHLRTLDNSAAQRSAAARLICANMGAYYQKYGMQWNQEIFDQNWPHRQNFGICHGDSVTGLLSMSLYNEYAYIRELQIISCWQNRGIGNWALQQAETLARQHRCRYLRLKVFVCNPALRLYDRTGFLIQMRDDNILGMQKDLAAAPVSR